jgi:hypothetical protein
MPMIEYSEDRAALSTFRPVDYRPPEEETLDPGIIAELGAAWRQDNTIGSYRNNKMAGINVAEKDGLTGDAIWNEIQGTPYEQHADRFMAMFNRRAMSALKSQIDMETEDRRILDAGGFSAVAAQFGMAVADLPSLLPGGSLVRNVRGGVNVVRSGVSTAAAGALGAGVSELALQSTQETRPLTESALAIGGGAILGGLLGSGVGAVFSKAERSAALKAVARAREARDSAPDMAEFRAGLAEGQSAGAAAVNRPVLEDYDIASGAKGIGAATARLNPLLRAADSPSAVYRSVMADMAETGFYIEKNTRGEGNLAVESAVKFWDRGALSKGLTDMKSIWTEARKSGLDMNEEGFRQAVSMAMRRGDVGDNEYVTKAARAWRSALFDPLKEQAIEVGLLPPGVEVKTAVSYLTRLWNAPRLSAEEPKFKNIVRPWINDQLSQLEFKADEVRIGNRIIDSDKAREAFDRVDSRLSGIEGRLSQRQGYREKRMGGLEELRQTRDDILKERAPKELVDMLRGTDENAVMVQALKEARAAARSAGKKKSFAERQPVLALIKSKGGVRIGSQLDSALRAMDVTPKTHPALFRKKGGIGDLDNFPIQEDDFLAGLPTDDTGMYVDPRELYEAVRSELAGVPLKSADELEADAHLDNIDKVASEWLEKVGLSENSTVKDVRGFINRVIAAERNTDGIDSRISRLEQELEKFDQTTDAMINERDITAAEAKSMREAMEALDAELEQVGDIANASPRVSLVVDLATTKRNIFKQKLKERSLSNRVESIKRLEGEGKANDELLAELAAKEIDLGRLRADIEGLKVKADRLEPMQPKVKQEIPEFVSPEDRADYVNTIVDDIFNQLTGRARQGMPSYDMVMAARGPLKERTFNIPDDLIEDFLEQDIELIARRYARVMAADVELSRMDKRLGGQGKPDLVGQTERVRADYQQLREEITASDLAEPAKAKARLELKKREASDLEDLGGVRDLLRGQYKLDSQHTNFARVLNVAQSFNFMRTLGGVLVTSVTDAVRPAMVHGLGRYMGQGIAPLLTNLKGVKMAVEDAKLIGAVTERVLQSRIATMAELADPYAQNSPFERLIGNMSNTFAKMTFLPHWNDVHKSIASVITQNRILQNAMLDYGTMKPGERSYMGFVGIDAFMAERIAKQFDEFGSIEGNVHVPGIERWTDDGARRAFAGAVNKDVDGIIITKGVADVPLFAHSPAGRALLQFRTFALSSHQRLLMRGMQESQARFWTGVVGMAGLGMAAYWFKQKESDRPLSTNVGTWMAEGIERAGIFAIGFEINNVWEKLGGPGFFALAGAGGQAFDPSADARQPASRFANRDAFGALLGPSFQLGTDTAQLLGIPARATGGDFDLKPADINRSASMIPFYTLPYWRWFLEGGFDLEEKTGFKGVEPMLKEAVDD